MSRFFSLFRGSKSEPLTTPTQADHYFEELEAVGGQRRELALVSSQIQGPSVSFMYQWSIQLGDQDADRLDSRVRAFAACAIHDAAVAGGCHCDAGPIQGRRPSWIVDNCPVPIGVVEAGFSVENRTCHFTIGPIMLRPDLTNQDSVSRRLARGFRDCFSRIIA